MRAERGGSQQRQRGEHTSLGRSQVNGARGRRGGRLFGGPKGVGRLEKLTESQFVMRRNLLCPDCLDAHLSAPEADPRLALGPWNIRRSGCSTCGGIGEIPAEGKIRLDPYMTPKA